MQKNLGTDFKKFFSDSPLKMHDFVHNFVMRFVEPPSSQSKIFWDYESILGTPEPEIP